jgi:hypothetical protein
MHNLADLGRPAFSPAGYPARQTLRQPVSISVTSTLTPANS